MKHFKIFLFLLLAIIGSRPVYARLQGQAKIDSLLKELPRQKEDSNKVNLLSELAHRYSSNDPDKGIEYGLQELALATRLQWKAGIASANTRLGVNYKIKSDYATALKYFETALKMSEDIDDKTGIANTIRSLGNIYELQSDNVKALACYFKALAINERINSRNGIALVCIDIGNIYDDSVKAVEYYFRALKIYEEFGNKQELAGVIVSIARVYQYQKNGLAKALEYNRKALELFDELGHKQGIATVLTNMGDIYSKQKDHALAIQYEQNALKIFKETGYKYGASITLFNIGSEYFTLAKNGNTDPGYKKYVLAQSENAHEAPAGKYSPGPPLPKGKTALLQAAMSSLQNALAMGTEIQTMDVVQNCYKTLAEAYKLSGNYRKAMECSDNYLAIRDSVFSKENNEQIVKLGLKNDYENQRLRDSLKTAQQVSIANIQLEKQKTFTYLGIAGILLLAGFSFFIVKERGKSENERKKSDALLLNILPTEVAIELKTNGTTTAKHYHNVTVLFTDFVNFTEAGERMSPQGLIDELHACFKMFDEITHKYNIEKIKTIGDAYLAVCGLPTSDPKHAENVVKAALEINAFMADRLAKLGSERTFAVRIGIHSGSVVAGIVGVKKFAYDIWGDTVNTTARMEQNSEAGKINISETTYELVKEKFSCEYRGEVEAKGKGVMKMYFVTVNS